MTSAPTMNEPRNEEEAGRTNDANMGGIDRWLSAIGGGALAAFGVSRRSLPGAALALTGGTVAYFGVRGRSPLYGALGLNTAETHAGPNASVKHREGVKVERSLTIDRPAEELYRFWRNFENLPRFMDHLESVSALDREHSRWRAKAPAGRVVEWEAEIINERENELIAWRSTEGSAIGNAGSVHFKAAPGGRGTEVHVVLQYDPPGGPLADLIARLFGEQPDQQVREDLRRFKEMMETGEVATTDGQPSARS